MLHDQSIKCRLTARRFMQRENIDFFSTYSPVATPATIRIVVAIAACFGVNLKTADTAQPFLAFLHSPHLPFSAALPCTGHGRQSFFKLSWRHRACLYLSGMVHACAKWLGKGPVSRL